MVVVEIASGGVAVAENAAAVRTISQRPSGLRGPW